VLCAQVKYTKDARAIRTPPPEQRRRLMWTQKTWKDRSEKEYRLVLAFSGPLRGAPETLWVDLPWRPRYCKRLYPVAV
jgi:hypothetical protein